VGAHLLHFIQETGTDLLGQHLPDQGAEVAHVIAQRQVGGGKTDVAALLVHHQHCTGGPAPSLTDGHVDIAQRNTKVSGRLPAQAP